MFWSLRSGSAVFQPECHSICGRKLSTRILIESWRIFRHNGLYHIVQIEILGKIESSVFYSSEILD